MKTFEFDIAISLCEQDVEWHTFAKIGGVGSYRLPVTGLWDLKILNSRLMLEDG